MKEYILTDIQEKIQANISKNRYSIQAVGVDPTGTVNFLFNASLLIDIICESIKELEEEQEEK